MNTDFVSVGPPMPALILWPASLVFLTLIGIVVWRLPSPPARFIVMAFAVRFVASAFHFVTYASSPLGLSWNALISIALVGLGVLMLRAWSLRVSALIPFYILGVLIAVSGLLNQQFTGLADMLVKYAFLAILMLLSRDALEELGAERFFKALLWPFALPLTFQFLSVALGIAKASEVDGSVSYVGGYNHEAAFSLILVTGLTITCLAPRMNAAIKTTLIAAFSIGILLANYRTSILGVLPLVAVVLATGATTRFTPRSRPLIAGMMIAVVGVVGILAMNLGQERFSDLAVVAEQGSDLIRPPRDFSPEDRRLLSGRPYIWSAYFYAYEESTPLQKLIGAGPGVWEDTMALYAHNTLVSTLYELGIAGLAAVLLLWFWMLALAFRIPRGAGPKLRIIAAHIGFVLVSQATMPQWMIEGLLFYGVVCGYTLYLWQSQPLPVSGVGRTLRAEISPGTTSDRPQWAGGLDESR